jgi:uncharacterized membrane protein
MTTGGNDAMSDSHIFVYAGIYGSAEDAEIDYETIKALHHERAIGSFDLAILSKDASGKVKVHKREKPTQHGAWAGLVVGGVIGLVFPPTLVATAVWAGGGAALGAILGHLAEGMSRGDLKDLGEELDQGEVALIVIAKDKLDDELDKMFAKATKRIDKALAVDHRELQAEIDRAFDEVTKQA